MMGLDVFKKMLSGFGYVLGVGVALILLGAGAAAFDRATGGDRPRVWEVTIDDPAARCIASSRGGLACWYVMLDDGSDTAPAMRAAPIDPLPLGGAR